MKIKRFIGGSLESNGYVIYERESGNCYIIDPGYNPQIFLEYVKEKYLNCKGIILTHLHHDHVGAAKAIKAVLDCDILMHEDDAFHYKEKVDIYLKDGDLLYIDNEEIRIIHTPGHTQGSICIMSDKSRVCFTGDTLFDTDLGRTDLEGGSEAAMKNSICNIVDKWDNDITIYPGHDNGCTMKKIRSINSEFLSLKEGSTR